jgi:peptidoglycan/xylan/chitin deacetylase (PgdA/CDA1 family)
MDHPHYRYSALPLRKPEDSPPALHLFVVLYLEHWDFEPPEGSVRDPRFVGEFGSFSPDYRSWTQREMGLRIGVFRLIEALRERAIKPAVAANSLVLPRVPGALEQLKDMGAQWLGHGVAATRLMHAGQTLDEQRAQIAASLQALAQHTGAHPLGWLSQDWGTSEHTYGLLADAGVRYTLDWGNDDQPYWLEPAGTSARRLLAVPLSSEWDDVQAQWLRPLEPAQHARLMHQAAERLAAECQANGRSAVMGLGLHPWLWGMPSRIRYLRELLGALAQVPGLQMSTPEAIWRRCADGQIGSD